jgi:superfamily I DNA/RNA helicase
VLTMHKAKGLEFNRVILYDLSEGAYPPPHTLRNVLPEDMPETLSRARSLLYVAASRARDELVVTYEGRPSPLITDC